MVKTLAWQAFWGYQKIVKKRVRLPWQMIGKVLGNNLEMRQFRDVPDLPNLRQWTESEAAQMAKENYRQTYLIGEK